MTDSDAKESEKRCEVAWFDQGRTKVFIVALPNDLRFASGLGIEVDGTVIVKTPEQWFQLGKTGDAK